MSLKQQLDKNTPTSVQFKPEYSTLLAIIKQNKLKTKKDVINYLEKEIKKTQKNLDQSKLGNTFSREGTSLNRKRVADAKWLNALKKIKALAKKHLQ